MLPNLFWNSSTVSRTPNFQHSNHIVSLDTGVLADARPQSGQCTEEWIGHGLSVFGTRFSKSACIQNGKVSSNSTLLYDARRCGILEAVCDFTFFWLSVILFCVAMGASLPIFLCPPGPHVMFVKINIELWPVKRMHRGFACPLHHGRRH